MKIKIEISVGELLDKISILKIKKENIRTRQVTEIKNELKFLEFHGNIIRSQNTDQYDKFLEKLISINSKLWNIEDEIRILEKKAEFNEKFISLARDVYFTNDDRFICKNEVNEYYGSEVNEVKEYVDYKNE